MKYYISPIIILALLVNSCFNPEQGCKKFVDEFFPIAEGNYWKMDVNYYTSGNIDTTKTDTYTICLENVYQKIINESREDVGEESFLSEEPDEYRRLFFQNSSGVFNIGYYIYDSLVYHDPTIIYKYPVNAGETWSVRRYTPMRIAPWLTDRGLIEYSCVATDEPFVTPADTFSTIVYYYLTLFGLNGYHQHTYEYFAYGVGKVGMEIYLSTDSTYTYAQRNRSDLHSSLKLFDYCLY